MIIFFGRRIFRNNLSRDLAVVFLSVVVAILMVKTGVFRDFLTHTQNFKFFGSFIAGMFFTSIFTTALATVALGEIARADSLLWTAFLGSLGAMCGDLIIFRFIKNRLAEDVAALLKDRTPRRLASIFKLKFFRWLTAFLGALVIASPLPDEAGLAMMGLSKIKSSVFIPMSIAFNFIGILVIGLIARAL